MSVINQMLRDLEQRHNGNMTESPLKGLSAGAEMLRSTPQASVLLAASVLILTIFSALLFDTQNDLLKKQEAPPQQLSLVTPEANQSAMEGKVDGITQSALIQSTSVNSSEDSLQSVETLAPGNEQTVMDSPELNSTPEEPPKTATDNVVVASTEPLRRPNIEKHALPRPQRQPSIQAKPQSVPTTFETVAVTEKHVEKFAPDPASAPANTSTAQPAKAPARQTKAPTEQTRAPPPPVLSSMMEKRVRPLTSGEKAQQLFQQAVLKLGRGEKDKAYDLLIKAVSEDPSHIRSRETLAALLLNTGRTSEASATLRDGLRINPKASGLAKLYGRILVNQGDISQAIAILEHAQPPVSQDPEYHALMAAFYARLGKHGQAAQVYQSVLRLRPGVSQWWMGLALSLESIGDSTNALSSYQRAQRNGGLTAGVQQFIEGRILLLTPLASSQAPSADFFGD